MILFLHKTPIVSYANLVRSATSRLRSKRPFPEGAGYCPKPHMESNHAIPSTAGIKDKAHDFWTSGLVDPVDLNFLCPIRYVHDYLPSPPTWLMPQPVSLSNILQRDEDDMAASPFSRLERVSSVYLHTTAARLPLHTGLKVFRQNKYWRANEDSTKELLQLFAQDRKCSDMLLSDNRSLSDLAEKQLENEVIDTYSRFSIYMFPEADEERIRLLVQSVILTFVFDGEYLVRLPGPMLGMSRHRPL